MLKNWVYTAFSTGCLIAYFGVMAKDCGAVSVTQGKLKLFHFLLLQV